MLFWSTMFEIRKHIPIFPLIYYHNAWVHETKNYVNEEMKKSVILHKPGN